MIPSNQPSTQGASHRSVGSHKILLSILAIWISLSLASDKKATATGRGAIISVIDFGAQGDGVKDDTKAFQAAVDALGPQGGCVNIPPGIYSLDQILIGSRVRLFGAGRGATVLKKRPGSAVLILPKEGTQEQVGIADMTLDGNGAVAAKPVAASNTCAVRDLRIERVRITGGWLEEAFELIGPNNSTILIQEVQVDPPIATGGGTPDRLPPAGMARAAIYLESVSQARISQVQISEAGLPSSRGAPERGNGNGIELQRCRDVIIADNSIRSVAYNVLAEFCNNLRIDGNTIRPRKGYTVGIQCNACTNLAISNNDIEDSGSYHIMVAYHSRGFSITGNRLRGSRGDPGLGATDSEQGVIMGNVIGGINCHGLVVGGEANQNQPGVFPKARNISIVGNVVVGNAISGIVTALADNITISGNLCMNNGGWAESGQPARSDFYGIYISSSKNCVVSGNRCGNDGSQATQWYGMGFDGTAANPSEANVISGNQLEGNTRGNYLIGGGWGPHVTNTRFPDDQGGKK